MYTVAELYQRLDYAKCFTPHKIGYYEQLLKEAKEKQTLPEQIEQLQNGQTVTIQTNNWINKGAVTGTVHKGVTNCGKRYFYIAPLGDPHPGASITKSEILSIL